MIAVRGPAERCHYAIRAIAKVVVVIDLLDQNLGKLNVSLYFLNDVSTLSEQSRKLHVRICV